MDINYLLTSMTQRVGPYFLLKILFSCLKWLHSRGRAVKKKNEVLRDWISKHAFYTRSFIENILQKRHVIIIVQFITKQRKAYLKWYAMYIFLIRTIKVVYCKNTYTEISFNAILILLVLTFFKFFLFLRLDTISQKSTKRDMK